MQTTTQTKPIHVALSDSEAMCGPLKRGDHRAPPDAARVLFAGSGRRSLLCEACLTEFNIRRAALGVGAV
jgi:hypothetical protein